MESFLTSQQADNIGFIRSILPESAPCKTIKICHNANTYNSFAYCLDDKYILRFPKHEKAKQKLIKEHEVLDFLKNKTSLNIPQTALIRQDYLCILHRKIPGENISQAELSELSPRQYDQFCADIALFMFQLHSLTDEISKNISLNFWERFNQYPRSEIINQYFQPLDIFSDAERLFIDKFLNTFQLEEINPIIKFGHFDIMSKNLAFDNKKQILNGIYDFGDCGIGNILHDFSQIALDFNIKTIANIIKYYRQYDNVVIDIKRINHYSLFTRLAFIHKYQNQCGTNAVSLLKEKLNEIM